MGVKDFFDRPVVKNISISLLVGVVLFGLFKYIDYRENLVYEQIETVVSSQIVLAKKISNLGNSIQGTQENIYREQVKNSSLVTALGAVSDTVGALSKLSKTDPELLKKYSKVYFLNEHYVPLALSDIPAGYASTKAKSVQLLADTLPFFQKMVDAGHLDGVSILSLSAYRSFGTQAILKSNYKVTYGAGTANSFSADQGYSEHQLGTAMDLTTEKTDGALSGFDKTPEYAWLSTNAYKYGFVLSYPKGNKYYIYEPWHWRFVGVGLATYLHSNQLNFYDADQRVIDNYLGNLFDPG